MEIYLADKFSFVYDSCFNDVTEETDINFWQVETCRKTKLLTQDVVEFL